MDDDATAAMDPGALPAPAPTGGSGGPGRRSMVMIVSAVLVIGLAAGIGIALALGGGSDSGSKSAAASASSSSTTSATKATTPSATSGSTATTAAKSGGGGSGTTTPGTTPAKTTPTTLASTTTTKPVTKIISASVDPNYRVCPKFGGETTVIVTWESANATGVRIFYFTKDGGTELVEGGTSYATKGSKSITIPCNGNQQKIGLSPGNDVQLTGEPFYVYVNEGIEGT